jgi:RNA polymerase sigma factor (sigma-70 family)
MTADSTINEDGKDPITIALEDGDVRQRLLKAARTALSRFVRSLSAIQIKAEAEEIVSRTINEVLRRRHTYDADCDIVAWIVGFIFNVARDYSRKYSRTPTGPPQDALQLEDLAVDVGRSVADVVENKEFVEQLLAKLSPKERCLIEMKYCEDLTFSEIAERMNMNESAARVWHHRIMRQLRQLAGNPGEVQS